jgi:hypothetical protein
MLRALMLLVVLSLTACDIPPSHSELYPPESDTKWHSVSVTHDRYHPWQYQRYDTGGGH